MSRRIVLFGFLLVSAGSAVAEAVAPPSQQAPDGVIRVWGNAQTADVVRRWKAGFEAQYPTIHLQLNLTGSDVGMAGLYTAQADVALLGRDATPSEAQAYEWVFRTKAKPVPVMLGSVDKAGKSPALAVLVHRSNPLERISLRQLAAVFGREVRQNIPPVQRWGQLDVGGEWAGRAIRLYSPMSESGTGRFFRQRVLSGSNKMPWDSLTEFDDPVVPGHGIDRSGEAIVAAVAADRDAMAIGNLNFTHAHVKALALSEHESGNAHRPTRATVASGEYPLTREVVAYVHQTATGELDPQVRLFLNYVLSERGQLAVAKDDGYLPLSTLQTATSLQRLSEDSH